MNNLWYIRRARSITGPYPANVIKEKIRAGEVIPTDEIGVGNDRWLNARAWDVLSTIPEQYSPGIENQQAFRAEEPTYPAPPPLPTEPKAPPKDKWGWAKILLALFIWGYIAADMKQQQKPIFKSAQQKQPPKSIIPKPLSHLE
jgi:hypothetical protein